MDPINKKCATIECTRPATQYTPTLCTDFGPPFGCLDFKLPLCDSCGQSLVNSLNPRSFGVSIEAKTFPTIDTSTL